MQRNWVTQKANCLEAVWVFAHTLYERKTFLIYRKARRLYQDTWDVQLSRLCLPWSMWPHIFKVRLIMVWCYIDVVQEMCSWIINLNSAKLTVKAWADQELILSWKFSLTRIGQDAMLHVKVQLHSWHFCGNLIFSACRTKEVLLSRRVQPRCLLVLQQLEIQSKCQTYWDF